jgi:hypothetical protein
MYVLLLLLWSGVVVVVVAMAAMGAGGAGGREGLPEPPTAADGGVKLVLPPPLSNDETDVLAPSSLLSMVACFDCFLACCSRLVSSLGRIYVGGGVVVDEDDVPLPFLCGDVVARPKMLAVNVERSKQARHECNMGMNVVHV